MATQAAKRIRRSRDQLSPSEVRDSYMEALQEARSEETIIIASPGPWFEETKLVCWHIRKDDLEARGLPIPNFFSFSGDKWQYSIGSVDGKRLRPAAYRVPFYGKPGFDDPNLTVSHLCHNAGCLNPTHVVLEPLDVNKGRNGCPGGAHCHHKTRCLRPGPTFDA